MNKIEKYTVFRSELDGEVYAIRNLPPMFTVKYMPGNISTNISFEDFKDELPPDPIKVAKLMRGVGEEIARFLQSEQRGRD